MPCKKPRRLFSRLFIAVVLLATAALTSCSNDDETTSPEEKDPEITITIPGKTGNGASDLGTVTDAVTFSIGSDDASGIDKIEIKIDGTLVQTLTTAPFNVTIDTQKLLGDGKHTLVVVVALKNGKTITAEATFTVQNVLVTIDVPENFLDIWFDDGNTARGFVFLSDKDGKTIVAKEIEPGKSLELKAPGFTGEDFYLTEVIAYDIIVRDKIMTWSHVKRGGKWVLTNDQGGGEWAVEQPHKDVQGEAQLSFVNGDLDEEENPVNYQYVLEGLSDWTSMEETANLYSSSSPVFVLKMSGNDPYESAPTHYALMPKPAKIGMNDPMDLSLVTNPISQKQIAIPGADWLYVSTFGITETGQYDKDLWIGSTHWGGSNNPGTDSRTLWYPSTGFAGYYSITEAQFGDLTMVNAKRDIYDATTFNGALNISIAGHQVTGSATGDMDYINVIADMDEPKAIWRLVAAKGEQNLIFPEIPALLDGIIARNLEPANIRTRVDAFDIKNIEGYTGFQESIRKSRHGLNDAFVFGAEYRFLGTAYKDGIDAGRQSSKRTISSPHAMKKK